TFLLGAGLPGHTMVAVQYATNSLVAGADVPNELELAGRWAALRQEAGAPVDVALQAAYNTAAASPDAEVTLARLFGPVRLMATGRVLGRGYDRDTVRYAGGGGALVRLGRHVARAGGLVTLLDRGVAGARAGRAAPQRPTPGRWRGARRSSSRSRTRRTRSRCTRRTRTRRRSRARRRGSRSTARA